MVKGTGEFLGSSGGYELTCWINSGTMDRRRITSYLEDKAERRPPKIKAITLRPRMIDVPSS